ncbi:MAG TPA: hypothetical protein VLY03_04265 [Bacteroidota bacterium]|nr:hypothetical protein [Bacteroidota bacterium]
MGNITLIDIVGSYIIAALLFIIMLKMDGNLSYANFTAINDLTVQTNIVTAARIIEEDFRKIGYCEVPNNFPDPSKGIVAASQHSITFITDIPDATHPYGDGILDTISYTVGTAAALTQTKNPNDFVLYRKVSSPSSSKTTNFSIGLTRFDFTFYDAQEDSLSFPITVPSAIYEMRLTMLLQSPFAYDTTYSYSYWRQMRLASRNLKAR